MKWTVDCESEMIRKMSHSRNREMRLMVSEDVTLFEWLSERCDKDGVKFKVTVEEMPE